MKILFGLSSNSTIPGGNSRPDDEPPGLHRSTPRRETTTISKTITRKNTTISKANTPGPKKKPGGKTVIKKRIQKR